MIKDTMFVIAVPNLQASADYYKKTLDFDVVEIDDPGWRMFVKDNCHVMVGDCP